MAEHPLITLANSRLGKKGAIGFVFCQLPIGGRSLRDIDLRRHFYALALAAPSSRSIRSAGEVVLGTAVGSVRSDNQDVALHLRVRRGRAPESNFQVSLVCDGMGGLKAGKEAAALAASRFLFALLRERRIGRESCFRAARTADAAVHQRLNGGGGTTLSAVIATAEGFSIGVHVGDSRIYAIGVEGALNQLSRDDNLKSALNQEREIDAALGSRLIQFIGMGDEVEPHVFRIPDDIGRLLITSDGAHSGAMSTLSSIVRFAPTGLELIRRILNVAEYTGGLDNASAIVTPANPASIDHWEVSDDAQIITVVTPYDSVEFYMPDYYGEPDGLPHRYYGGSSGSPTPKMPSPPPPPRSSSSEPIASSAPTPAPQSPMADQPTRAAGTPETSLPKVEKPTKKRKPKSTPRKKAEHGGELPLEAAPSVLVEFPDDKGEPQ